MDDWAEDGRRKKGRSRMGEERISSCCVLGEREGRVCDLCSFMLSGAARGLDYLSFGIVVESLPRHLGGESTA